MKWSCRTSIVVLRRIYIELVAICVAETAACGSVECVYCKYVGVSGGYGVAIVQGKSQSNADIFGLSLGIRILGKAAINDCRLSTSERKGLIAK